MEKHHLNMLLAFYKAEIKKERNEDDLKKARIEAQLQIDKKRVEGTDFSADEKFLNEIDYILYNI